MLVPVVSDRLATVVLAHSRSMRLILPVLRSILGYLLVVLENWLGRSIQLFDRVFDVADQAFAA